MPRLFIVDSPCLDLPRTLRPPWRVLVLAKRERRVDQPDVGERLREVAERGAGVRVDLLGEEPDVVGVVEQPLERRRCAATSPPRAGTRLPRSCRCRRRPRRAAARRRSPWIAVDQAVRPSRSWMRAQVATHPRVRGVDVAVERQGEQAGVEVVAVEEPGVAAEPLVVPARLDRRPDRVPLGAEPVAIDRAARPASCSSIRRSSATQQSTFEWVWWDRPAAPFPDPLVRLAPAPADRLAEPVEQPRRVAVEVPAAAQRTAPRRR